MLKGLDPLLSPDLLQTLAAMGHGDEIVIADANYPAESMGLPVVRLAPMGTATSWCWQSRTAPCGTRRRSPRASGSAGRSTCSSGPSGSRRCGR